MDSKQEKIIENMNKVLERLSEAQKAQMLAFSEGMAFITARESAQERETAPRQAV